MDQIPDKLPCIETTDDGGILHCTCGHGTRLAEFGDAFDSIVFECKACQQGYVVKRSQRTIIPLVRAMPEEVSA